MQPQPQRQRRAVLCRAVLHDITYSATLGCGTGTTKRRDSRSGRQKQELEQETNIGTHTGERCQHQLWAVAQAGGI